MEERQSRWSSMGWKRLRPFSCARLIPQNSMFSNFCHVLKSAPVVIGILMIASGLFGYIPRYLRSLENRVVRFHSLHQACFGVHHINYPHNALLTFD